MDRTGPAVSPKHSFKNAVTSHPTLLFLSHFKDLKTWKRFTALSAPRLFADPQGRPTVNDGITFKCALRYYLRNSLAWDTWLISISTFTPRILTRTGIFV